MLTNTFLPNSTLWVGGQNFSVLGTTQSLFRQKTAHFSKKGRIFVTYLLPKRIVYVDLLWKETVLKCKLLHVIRFSITASGRNL